MKNHMDAKIITTKRIQQNNIKKHAKGDVNERLHTWKEVRYSVIVALNQKKKNI